MMRSVVYFLRAIPSGNIKIGISTNPKARIGTLRTATHEAIEVIGMIAGDARLERKLHKEFADFRLAGEWFRPSSRLMARIDELCVEPIDLGDVVGPASDDYTKKAAKWLRLTEDLVAARSGQTVLQIRPIVAARCGLTVGTLANLRKERTVSISARDFFAVERVFIEEHKSEIKLLNAEVAALVARGFGRVESTTAAASLASAKILLKQATQAR